MSDLGTDGLQEITGGSLASQSDQPARASVLPPFCGKLNADVKLKLSQTNFKQTIYDTLKDRYTTPLSQLTTTPLFPTPHVLAQFASKAYTDYKTRETEAQYETRLDLPDGWKLLTTASNFNKTNGYFGAAYWHPEHQQVVIAHRGTDCTNVGALWRDFVGVMFENYVPQMESACTFTDKVVEALREVGGREEVSFQLFFTGHSLGGWLAQITTFTAKYLKTEGNIFLKNNNPQNFYHPLTVVFDSPGCKDMLSQMRSTFDVRLHGRSIELEHLDITSYLSAPNRINTCNEHVGTVYRIFPDLSDTGWWKKLSTLNNLATHNIKKIVEAFDPQTGEVRKDKEGKLKAEVVLDWPISTDIGGGEEYQKFFVWSEKFTDYHPDITGDCFQYLDYCQLRYQTERYNEQVKSLSVFSQEEQDFLKDYRDLRQWPQFCKPKELFSALGDNKASEEAGKKLQSFEIENNRVSSEEARALQELIPYVKRLLQLYPKVKEIKTNVLQCETRSCFQRISQSPLEFHTDASSFTEFLESKQQKVLHIQMSNGDEWTGLIKVHQVLEKTGCLIEGQYIVLKLESLMTPNKFLDFSTLTLSGEARYLLLVACKATEHVKEETKDTIRTYFETMNKNPRIKVILTSGSEDKAIRFLQDISREIFGSGFVTRDEELTWRDLTSSSHEKLLQKSVKFQDAEISLDKLIPPECPVAEMLPIGDLLAGRELNIGDPVPVSNGYNEGYYIGRTFRVQKAIKQDIFNDKSVTDSHVYLARSEQEYKQLRQLHPDSNVHWIEKDNSEKLLWQETQGSLETVRKYIDSDISHTYTDGDLDKLLEQAQHQRVMVISDTAGMGKSTVLTHLSQIIKRTSPAKWVVRIDLNNHTDVLNVLKEEQIDSTKVIEFVSEKLLKLKPGLEMELFKQCCRKEQKVRIVMMLDGFDEVSPFYKETVFGLLQALRQTEVEQLWVTTRPNLRDELEDKLQQLSFTLQPFSEENQVEFLTKFWRLKDWFIGLEEKAKEIEKNRLEIYAEHLIKEFANSISDKDKAFTGIPLHTRMLAEAFDGEVKIFCLSSEPMPDLPLKLDLLELYGRFIEIKYDIYQEEKCQVKVNNLGAKVRWEHYLKIVRQEHQLLAMKVPFTEEQVALLQNNNQCTFSVEELTRFGLVQLSHEGKPHFIHRSFAEYYVANFFVNNTSQKVQDFIQKDIFLKEEYQVIRVFINGLLSRSKPSKVISIQYGTWIDNLGNDCLLHTAALEGNANIIEFMLESARAAGHRDKIIGLLLGQDKEKRTAWYLAAARGVLEVLEILSVWAKKNLSREEIQKKLLLAKDSKGNTAWHWAAYIRKQDVLQKIWDFAKDNLTAEVIKKMLFLATDSDGNTAWHLVAKGGNQDILQKICDFAKVNLTAEEIKNMLCLATDSDGNTAWHLAALWGNQDVLQKIWNFAKDNLTAEEIKNNLLVAKDKHGNTAWHLAAKGSNEDVLQKIWDFAKDYLTAEEIKNTLFLATDSDGNTAWHLAAKGGNQEVLQKLCDLAKDNLTAEEIKKMLCLGMDSDGNSAWHLAALWGNRTYRRKFGVLII